jgi:hypothetical protein
VRGLGPAVRHVYVTASVSPRVANITRDCIKTFIADTLDRWKPKSAALSYCSLQ